MTRPYALTYLSLGAGVQSTALLVMSALGLYDCPRADVAIFADTQDEPRWVYDHLATLIPWSANRGIRVDVVTRGRLSDTFDCGRRVEKGLRRAFIPAFTGPVIRKLTEHQRATWGHCPECGADDGDECVPTRHRSRVDAAPLEMETKRGIMHRQCTNAYKIEPIEAHVRSLLGVARGCRMQTKANPRTVCCLQGISLDEAHRAKDARTPWVTAEFPLLDARLKRGDCLRIIREAGLPEPKKSSCVYCPFHGDDQWRMLRDLDPEGWAKAVTVDRQIRDYSKAGLKRPLYLHTSLKPLDEIDFTDYQGRLSFPDGWGNACGGECGV